MNGYEETVKKPGFCAGCGFCREPEEETAWNKAGRRTS
jgi:predicted Fe-S protein YdhL (DUF1289 family)